MLRLKKIFMFIICCLILTGCSTDLAEPNSGSNTKNNEIVIENNNNNNNGYNDIYNLKIGDIGPGGGYIFYINPSADTDGWKYLEAAPYDQSTGLKWYNGTYFITEATDTEIGSGETNTLKIIAWQGDYGNYAAKICNDLIINGYDDWFLPSKDELYQMFINLESNGLGDFNGYGYWSSTEDDEDSAIKAWSLSFYDRYSGISGKARKDNDRLAVRAIRAF